MFSSGNALDGAGGRMAHPPDLRPREGCPGRSPAVGSTGDPVLRAYADDRYGISRLYADRPGRLCGGISADPPRLVLSWICGLRTGDTDARTDWHNLSPGSADGLPGAGGPSGVEAGAVAPGHTHMA